MIYKALNQQIVNKPVELPVLKRGHQMYRDMAYICQKVYPLQKLAYSMNFKEEPWPLEVMTRAVTL